MAYNLNFPQPLDFMRDSQPLMLDNFAEIFNFIGQDHEQFNTANAGKHKQLTFPEQTADPANQSTPTLFCKASPFTNIIQLFVKNALNQTNGFSDRFVTPILNGQVNWVSLPSGIVFKWQFIFSRGSTGILNTHTWGNQPVQRPFTQQFWSIVIPMESPDENSNVMTYVSSLTPTQVNYTVFLKAGITIGNVPGQIPDLIILSIGV